MFDEQIKQAKQPGKMTCPTCGEDLFSPMDKLSILMYGECGSCINGVKLDNLLKVAEFL